MSMRKDYVPTQRWHVLHTTGKPLMTRWRAVAASVNDDSVVLTVPQGERWVILDAVMKHCTLSSGSSIIQMVRRDPEGNNIGHFIYADATTTATHCYPLPQDVNIPEYAIEACPCVLYEGQQIRLLWAANANKSGTEYYYINCLQFDVGKGTQLSSRVQSPNVGDAWRLLGAAAPPQSFPVLPAMMGTVDFPYKEYRYFKGYVSGLTADGLFRFMQVPTDEDWLWVSWYVTHAGGDGHLDGLHLEVPQELIQYYGTSPGTTTYLTVYSGAINLAVGAFQAGVFESPIPVVGGTWLNATEDFAAANDSWYIGGTVIRRKWQFALNAPNDMSEDWCRLVEQRLDEINDKLIDLQRSQMDIIKYVIVGLLAIAGTIVGINAFSPS